MSSALEELYGMDSQGQLVDLNIPGFHEVRLLVNGMDRQVYTAVDDETNEVVAIKMINFQEDNALTVRMIRELMHIDLKHENIVTLKSVYLHERSICLVMEYIPMDLEAYMIFMTSPKPFLKQILEGLSFLHTHGVLHRDLKPANILVDDSPTTRDPVVKIADFGLSRAFLTPNVLLSPGVGAWGYKAPEIVLGSEHYSYPADIWAVGCIFAEMVTSKPPFPGYSRKAELTEIFRVLGIPTEEAWPGVSSLPRYADLMSNPDLDPHQPATGLATHVPGLEPTGLDLLSKMLSLCPETRITAEAALEHDYFA